jgi:excinuclease ABC subunit C
MIDVETLPNNPGCYLFKDDEDKILYIGKAKNIKKRVKSYFQKDILDPKTKNLVKNIDSVDIIVTDNEFEALILENNLVKKHQPKFNIDLKDAKSFAYIQLTKEDFPRVLLSRRKIGYGKFYGPFVSAQERDYILHFLRKTFTLRTCKKMPKKPCLRYHIKLCNAPCIGLISKEEYSRKIENIKLILSGKTNKLLKKLDSEMNSASEMLDFEKAIMIRSQITAITHLTERQNMQREKKYDEDIFNYRIKDDKVYLMLFNIHKGTLVNKNEFVFDFHDEFLEEFIVRYYSESPIPKEVIIPKVVSSATSTFLSKEKKSKVTITVPKQGEKKQLLSLVLKNIEIAFFSDTKKVDELKKKLLLQETPRVIECFDISHISGTSTVGSMVQFRNGKPDKSNYRRFRIRTVEGIDDYAAISEVVRRRYSRLKNEDETLPNLIVIDGGKGQLSSALEELERLELKIPIISIAKQFEEIYMPGVSQPLCLAKKEKALQFIQEMRDEAHRFAIKYNRLLRKKELIP